MGIFSSIKEKLFGKAHAAETAEAVAVTPEAAKPVTAGVAPAADAQPAAPAAPSASPAAPAPSAPSAPVDVAAIMDEAVKAHGQKLDWRHSIVDMMKALDLDSSLAARKELAEELHYAGDKNDSAAMNVWLHKALMKALADNGGKVPAELLD